MSCSVHDPYGAHDHHGPHGSYGSSARAIARGRGIVRRSAPGRRMRRACASRHANRSARIASRLLAAEGCLILVCAFLSCGTSLFGLAPFAVLSGSMEPTIPTGSLIYVRAEAPPEAIRIGDVIAFYASDDRSVICTHRVIGNDVEGRSIATKGDANEDADLGEVPYEHVMGTVAAYIPTVGYVLYGITENRTLWVAGICALTTVLAVLSLRMRKADARKPGVHDAGAHRRAQSVDMRKTGMREPDMRGAGLDDRGGTRMDDICGARMNGADGHGIDARSVRAHNERRGRRIRKITKNTRLRRIT